MHKHFKRRFEFYYQSVAVYAVALILYSIMRGTFSGGEFRIVFKDPIVVVFIIVLGYSIVVLVFNLLYQRDVVVNDDSIIFQNRFDNRTVKLTEIDWIRVGRAKRMRVRGSFRVIKMKLNSQMRTIRINPVHFHDERGMMETFTMLGERVKKNV